MNSLIVISCITTDFEKQIVLRANRLILVHNVRGFRSFFLVLLDVQVFKLWLDT